MSFLSDILGPIGDIFGLLSGVNQLSGGKIEGSKSVPFVPGGLGMADQNWQQMFGKLWDQMQQSNPQLAAQLQGAFQGAQGATPGIQGAYGALGGMTPQFMQMLMGQAGTAQGAQRDLMGAGNQLWQNALDPQNAMRARLMQETQDASRAGSSMRGIGMGAESVGLENDATNRFMQAWQNQQLGRQAQGLQGMTGAYQQAGQQGNAVGQNLTGAMGMGAMGPQFLQQGAQYPFDVANMFGSGMNQNLYNPLLQAMTGGQNYMNTGVPATNANFGAGQYGLNNMTTALQQMSRLYQPQLYPGIGYGTAGSQDPSAGGAFAYPY